MRLEILRPLRKLLGRCEQCGTKVQGLRVCEPCTLDRIKDFDEVNEDTEPIDKPAYHEDDPPHWAEDSHYSCGDKS